VRLLFVLSCLLPGPQFLIYIALWIIMPSRDY
ncbi:MAG TPA: PspC domain-containing protein, partial [Pseudonocardiaceae bacterium]|nr:PspC domain-containing protein [Pseudonocardiaceae bacterium]